MAVSLSHLHSHSSLSLALSLSLSRSFDPFLLSLSSPSYSPHCLVFSLSSLPITPLTHIATSHNRNVPLDWETAQEQTIPISETFSQFNAPSPVSSSASGGGGGGGGGHGGFSWAVAVEDRLDEEEAHNENETRRSLLRSISTTSVTAFSHIPSDDLPDLFFRSGNIIRIARISSPEDDEDNDDEEDGVTCVGQIFDPQQSTRATCLSKPGVFESNCVVFVRDPEEISKYNELLFEIISSGSSEEQMYTRVRVVTAWRYETEEKDAYNSEDGSHVEEEEETTGADSNCLVLDVGDTIAVFSSDEGGWWYGEKERDGSIGYFPFNYCEPIYECKKKEEERKSSSLLLPPQRDRSSTEVITTPANTGRTKRSGSTANNNGSDSNTNVNTRRTWAIADAVRGIVSKKKTRFKQDGFDLDLSYVLPNRIIAMGFPSEGVLDGVYRNNMKDVQRFFQTFHPDKYKVYNLCSEREYDPFKFDNRVVSSFLLVLFRSLSLSLLFSRPLSFPYFSFLLSLPLSLSLFLCVSLPFCLSHSQFHTIALTLFPFTFPSLSPSLSRSLTYLQAKYAFDDHNACPFNMIVPFCEDVHSFLSEDEANAVAIHCKAGKGRTGTLIACYFLYAGIKPTASAALDLFAAERTQNKKGVTIPSQIRYVYYFEKWLKEPKGTFPDSRRVRIRKMTMMTIPKQAKAKSVDVWFTITNETQKLTYSSRSKIPPAR